MEKLIKEISGKYNFHWVGSTVKVETPEEFIINLMDSCNKVPTRHGYGYAKEGEQYFGQNDENKEFFYDYIKIFKHLESEFGYSLCQQKRLISEILRIHHNLEGYGIYYCPFTPS